MNPFSFFSSKLIFGTAVAVLLAACARQGSPTGGPKDTDPPRVDTLVSARNFSTHFSERRIELVFNEWITLSDVGTQVVISPTLAKRPEITLKGKKVIVEFAKDDTLRANTTYTINFGTAVKDLHEGNPAKDLRFVFSTGDYLDSLSVAGNVVEAFSGEPVENVSVMLYDNLADSIVRKENPYYFARTDKTGQFSIQNVRAGAFKMAAIEDATGDLKWDGQNERIGFADAPLRLNDSVKAVLNLKIFKNQPQVRLFDGKTVRYGLVRLTFTAPPDSAALRSNIQSLRFLTEKNQDTLFVWYDLPEPADLQLFVFDDDTVKVKNLPCADFLEKHKCYFADEAPMKASTSKFDTRPVAIQQDPNAPKAVKTISQSPVKQAVLPFNSPIVATDTSKWLLTVDSVVVKDFMAKPDSVVPRNLNVNLAWKAGKTYKFTLLPGAVTDFYGVANSDTLRRDFNIFSEKQLGGLNLTLQNLVPQTRYVLQLLSGNTTMEEERSFDADLTDKKLVFTNLPAATYTARLIEDRNRNGRWDSGDYFAKRQPEAVFSKKLDPLRANWEVEVTMQLGASDEKWKGKK